MSSDLDPGETMYRAHMRGLALKGGATTKRRYGSDPKYYRAVGRMGGVASAAARRERCRREAQAKAAAEGQAVAPAILAESPAPRKPTIADELRRLGLDDGNPDPTRPGRGVACSSASRNQPHQAR
jgi:hypothetical protein